MPNYVLNNNAQPNSGDHEVHVDNGTCAYMPLPQNRIALGSHTSCSSAVATAKARYPSARINGCYWCSNSCHTG